MTEAAASLPMSLQPSPSPATDGTTLSNVSDVGGKTSDFRAILASLPAPQAMQAEDANPTPAPMLADPELEAAATTLPDSGNTLPPRLPHLPTRVQNGEPVEDEPGEHCGLMPADRLDPSTADIALDAAVLVPVSLAAPTPPAPPFDEDESTPNPAVRDAAGSRPVLISHSGPPVVPQLAAAKPESQQSAREAAPAEPAPTAVATPEQARPLAVRPGVLALESDDSGDRPVPLLAITLRSTADQSRRDELPGLPAAPAATGTFLPAAPFATVTAHGAPSTPHDFAALVDRLAAAREAVQPQAVSVALSHVDFGPVRIEFRHEDGALNVSLANPDPDFATAVAAMPAIPPSAAPADTPQAQPRSAEARHGETGSHEFRGQSQSDRRGERPTPASPRFARHGSTDGTARSGIFA